MKTFAGWAYRRVPDDPLDDPLEDHRTTYEWTSRCTGPTASPHDRTEATA